MTDLILFFKKWRHRVRQSIHTEVARAELQCSQNYIFEEGDIFVVYLDDESGKWYCRYEKEFDDGRFEELDPETGKPRKKRIRL